MAKATTPAKANAYDYESKSLVKRIAFIKTASGKLKTEIALAAALCVMHAVKFGDITLGLSLIAALSENEGEKKGATPWRTNALRDWFVAEGPFAVSEVPTGDKGKTKKALVYSAAKAEKLKLIMDADEARFGGNLVRNPFWLAKPEPEFTGFDFDAEFAKLLAKAKTFEDKSKSAEMPEEKKAKIKLGRYQQIAAAASVSVPEITVH